MATHETASPMNEQFQVKVMFNRELSQSSYAKVFLSGGFKTTPDLVGLSSKYSN